MKIKQAVTISLITAGAAVVVLAAFSLATAPPASVAPGAGPSSGSATVTLTAAEVAKHDRATDCWSIVSGSVYNLTSLISSHSGGAEAILRNCGRDGTQAFLTKDRQPPREHSPQAQAMMAQMLVGPLGATVSGPR